MQKICTYLLLFLAMFFLVLFPNTCVNYAKSGLLLWFQVILPSLFPFIVLSRLLLETGAIYIICNFLAPFFSHLFHVSRPGSFVIFSGFLCGYPMGAKLTVDLLQKNIISKQEAEYLLSFCNNLSPVFVSTFLFSSCLQENCSLPVILSVVYGVPLGYGILKRPQKKKIHTPALPPSQNQMNSLNMELIDNAIMDGFVNITRLGGYIILCSVCSGCFTMLPCSPIAGSILSGLTEITTGLNHLASAELSSSLKILFSLPLSIFGGLCGILQTCSIIKDSPLSPLTYVKNKWIQCGISGVLLILYQLVYSIPNM